MIQKIKPIHIKMMRNKHHRSVSGPSLVWRLFPRPGEMAREVCPPLGDEEEEGETRREASEEDDLDRMHLLDLWKMPPEGGGGDCGIRGRTLHLGLREPPVLELEAVVPVHEAVPDDDLELNELREEQE